MDPRIYLDNNATTAIDPSVIKIMVEDLSSPPANPSSMHFYGQQAKNKLTKARQTLASYFKVKPTEIIFTSGGTESMNTLIRGFLTPITINKSHIISSNVEHSSVEKTLLTLKEQGCEVTFLPIGLSGILSSETLENAITSHTKLLVFSAVNSETGIKQDLEKLSKIALKHAIPLVIDGVALLGKDPFEIPPGVTGIGFSAHKFHGPKGIGFFFLRSHTKLLPNLAGGGQEYGLRSGTENLTGILGLAEAIALLKKELPEAHSRMKTLRDHFEQELSKNLPSLQIHGSSDRVCNVSNLAFPGVEAETLLIQLDLQGIAASHGSACSSGSLEPSRILTQMGFPLALVKSSVRFSLSRFTTKEEIDRTLDILIHIIPKLHR